MYISASAVSEVHCSVCSYLEAGRLPSSMHAYAYRAGGPVLSLSCLAC